MRRLSSMMGRSGAVLLTLAAAVGAGLVSCERKGPPPAQAPMVQAGVASVAFRTMSVYMSLAFRAGRGDEFAEHYADSAEFAATGFGTLRGRAAIASEFGTIAPRLTISAFVRESQGVAVNGRTVLDSGTYELTGEKGATKTDPHPKGKYWTVWSFADDGGWIIVADTLIGDGHTRTELAPRKRTTEQKARGSVGL